MDDLLRDFLTESNESLTVVDGEMVKLEANPNNKDVLQKIFRLVHTIKGTCGFIGLQRLEKVAHASENVLGKFRDGVLQVTEPTGSADLAHLLALAGSGEEGGPVELRFRVEAGASGPSRTALFLPSRPAETPVVVPNEVAAGLAWTWDPVQNAIVFDTPPPEGSEFVVRYEEPCSP